MLSQKKATTEKTFDHQVKIDWNDQYQEKWNEICIQVLEVFGLPGNRFVYRTHINYMVFEFESIKDKTLCKILLSEYL